MIVYKNYVSFVVLDTIVNLISDETDYGQTTFAEIDGEYFYRGHEEPNILTAIHAWQDIMGKEISMEETRQVMIDNHLLSE